MARERARLVLPRTAAEPPEAPARPAIDVDRFKPRAAPLPAPDGGAGPVEPADLVGAAHGFTRRETAPPRAPARRRRRKPFDGAVTIRAYLDDIDRFHAIADARDIKSGALFHELLELYQSQEKE